MAAGHKKRKWKTRKENRNRRMKAALCAILILLAAFTGFFMINQIKSVEVEGNEYYSDEEIKNYIINGALEQNAWYLYWKYKYGKTPEIPFVDTVEVSVAGTGRVKITVYEKGITGYVEYLDHYMYFDKDGIVVESSKKQMDGIPLIYGLNFQTISLYEALPVQKPEIFRSILNLAQLLKKSSINPDKIDFSDSDAITLHFDQAKVLLGSDENMEEKIVRLSYLINEIKGRSGVLHMENFNEDTKNITFENS